MKRLLRPLISGTTWRRFSFLVVGGAIFIPFLVLYVAFLSLFGNNGAHHGWTLALLIMLGIAGFVVMLVLAGLFPVVRALEGAFTKELVGAPEVLGEDRSWPARAKAAAWFAAHVITGAAYGIACIGAPSVAIWTFVVPFHERPAAERGDLAPITNSHWVWLLPVGGVLLTLGFLYGTVLLGKIAARLAPHALGPSAQERIEAVERRADALAERNRLARELHDSVGHALSIVTVQASAAARVLDQDPQFAKQALGAIEESARTALEDLDHVLGLLREEERSRRTPQRTLKDLDELLGNTGLPITVDCEGDLERIPAAVSREAYRIVQEGLTNVAKHAGHVPVSLRLAARTAELELDLTNPRGPALPGSRGLGGRGLNGLQERVSVLRGRMWAGPEADLWRVSVTIPITRGTT
ncbi:sensor histidine kinase [Actinocorallia longicatena]|uniref:histidine kinase n=1 Tax=Actinocorallia longicatena TaxID=111803 RepID=A0ABP6QAQ5_9ACTN